MFSTCSYNLRMRSAEKINLIFYELLALNTGSHVWNHILWMCIFSHARGTHAWLHFLAMVVAPVAIRPSVSQARTLCLLTYWLTRGYELLKVSLTTHGMSAEFPTAEDVWFNMWEQVNSVTSRCLLFIPACDEWTVLPRPDLYHDVNRFGHSAVFSDRWSFTRHLTKCFTERLYG